MSPAEGLHFSTLVFYILVAVFAHHCSSNPHHRDNTNLDVGKYAQVSVDRFTLLWDLWAWEAQFLLAKMKVQL